MTANERKEHIRALAKDALDTLDSLVEEIKAKDNLLEKREKQLAYANELIEKLTRANKEYADKFAELVKKGIISKDN